jgi:hypothetical protein
MFAYRPLDSPGATWRNYFLCVRRGRRKNREDAGDEIGSSARIGVRIIKLMVVSVS